MDEENDDELPSVMLNSSSRELVDFEMPSADILASQREQEAEWERQATLLTQTDDSVISLQQASSGSSSEGESALAAHVAALGVSRTTTRRSLTSALRRLPAHPLIDAYLEVLERGDAGEVAAVTDDMLTGVSSLLCEDNSWSDEDVVGVGAWLVMLCVGGMEVFADSDSDVDSDSPGVGSGVSRARARRVLQQLLDNVAKDQQIDSLSTALCSSLRGSRELCAAAGAGRSGAGRGGRLTCAMLRHALSNEHLTPGTLSCLSWATSCISGAAWSRDSEGGAALLATLVAGRLIALHAHAQCDVCALAASGEGVVAGEGEGGALVSALRRATSRQHTQTHTQLKVLGAVKKLQLLFREHDRYN